MPHTRTKTATYQVIFDKNSTKTDKLTLKHVNCDEVCENSLKITNIDTSPGFFGERGE